jgi:hypothetical protein
MDWSEIKDETIFGGFLEKKSSSLVFPAVAYWRYRFNDCGGTIDGDNYGDDHSNVTAPPTTVTTSHATATTVPPPPARTR